MSKSTLLKNIVTENREISPGVYLLSFEKKFDFTPGQIVALSLDPGDREPRLYSICSGTKENIISILFNIVPSGKITGQLAGLRPGEAVHTSRPYGRFTVGPESSFWVASGTGIAPFVSMLRSEQIRSSYLIHGGRDSLSFYFSSEFQTALGSKYIKCSSTLKEPGYFEGRVSAYLRNSTSLPMDYRYYLCGRAEMVVEARDILISKGIPYNMIEAEIYF